VDSGEVCEGGEGGGREGRKKKEQKNAKAPAKKIAGKKEK
jgi:hypothetical protein